MPRTRTSRSRNTFAGSSNVPCSPFREDDRLTRQAQLCNAVLEWLRKGQAVESVSPGEALVVPLDVLRDVRALSRGAAFSASTPYPLVPLSSADLLVNVPRPRE
jgi:hypothetical protein